MINIEKLYELRDKPEEFEAYTKQLLNDYFDSLPEDRRRKVQQTQWKIDAELRKYKDPVARMNRMAELFWEGVNEFNSVLQGNSHE